MNTSEELFRFLQALKKDDNSGKSAQEKLIEYCTQTLGAIERLHVDFKEKSDRRNAKLSDEDKKTLPKQFLALPIREEECSFGESKMQP